MSYLDVPRIHVCGQFFTDPSSVNNDPTHYDPAVTVPSPWQEPDGQHRFQWVGCTVRSAIGPDGDAGSDPIIGCNFISTDVPDPARLVDLDVYQQGVPAIIGMQVKITLPNGQFIVGNMDTAILNGLWWNAVLPTRSWGDDYVEDSFGGDMNACGFFQTVIRIDPANWPDTNSQILQTLKTTTLQTDGQYLLSFKFVIDGYQNVPQDKERRLGRMTGALGPVKPGEPLYNPGQRWLKPRDWATTDPWYQPSFNNCPFKVDTVRKKLIIDLANSICRQSASGPPVDLGTLNATVSTPDPVVVAIGSVDYSEFAYENNAHITEIDLNDAQLSVLQKGSLSLSMSRTDLGPQQVLGENAAWTNIAVEVRPIRMEGDPGTKTTTKVYVSRQGKPLANKQLSISVESVHGDTPGATVAPFNKGNLPQADGALQATITPTNADGFATLTLTVLKDPGARTPELDGSLYFVIAYDPDQQTHEYFDKNTPDQSQYVSCLVFAQYPVNTNPEWPVIEAMMAPYMKLYPFMKSRIDLTDLHTFTTFANNPPWNRAYGNVPPGPLGITAGAIPFYMSRDFTDPRLMPISRDLSANKLMTIMWFVKNLQAQVTPPPQHA
ncbi:MAG: hypothetical protein IT270_01945 [Saprospiraceae bacterium]|nr:hypothetical protein [Saprospiraceae bacterium]